MIFHDSSEAGLALHPHEMLSSLGLSPEDELQKRGEREGKKKNIKGGNWFSQHTQSLSNRGEL